MDCMILNFQNELIYLYKYNELYIYTYIIARFRLATGLVILKVESNSSFHCANIIIHVLLKM